MKKYKIFAFIFLLHMISIIIFSYGFLLTRRELKDVSQCHNASINSYYPFKSHQNNISNPHNNQGNNGGGYVNITNYQIIIQ